MGRYITINTEKNTPNPGLSYTKGVFGSGQYRVFNSSCSWTVPNNIGKVRVSLFGAGGGGGGHWAAMDGGVFNYMQWIPATCCGFCQTPANNFVLCCGACANLVTYDGMISSGGAGGGGGYAVSICTVTSGCSCCIVIGSGGIAGCSRAYWQSPNATWHLYGTNTIPSLVCQCYSNTGFLCASNGSSGGYTCAFGICASGGLGGEGGRCGYCSLANDLWCAANVCYANSSSPWCVCLAAQCVCGGLGGNGNGNIVSFCGGQGDSGGYANVYRLTCSSDTYSYLHYSPLGFMQGLYDMCWCCHQSYACMACFCRTCYCFNTCYVHPLACNTGRRYQSGGVAGSPLGHGVGSSLPNIFNGAAFNGCAWTSGQIVAQYDLPAPKWSGETIYSQVCGEVGSSGYMSCVCCNISLCSQILGAQNTSNLVAWSTSNCCITCICVCYAYRICYCDATCKFSCFGQWTGSNTCVVPYTYETTFWPSVTGWLYGSTSNGNTLVCITAAQACWCAPARTCMNIPIAGIGGGAVSTYMGLCRYMACYTYGYCGTGGSGQAIVEW